MVQSWSKNDSEWLSVIKFMINDFREKSGDWDVSWYGRLVCSWINNNNNNINLGSGGVGIINDGSWEKYYVYDDNMTIW